uniref:hypothetical protein n=1 Tax=Halosegnis longus TaxID=2216012 RepID=UPI001A8F7778
EFVQGRATHHEPQMAAYAVGLQALDPSRDVRATIVLTAADGACYTFSGDWEPRAVIAPLLEVPDR